MLRIVYDKARHDELHDMVFLAKPRLQIAAQNTFAHMESILGGAVEEALMNSSPARTGRIYQLYVRGKIIEHIASRFGETPAPITGKLSQSVVVKYAGDRLDIFETADYAKYLEGQEAEGTIRWRPHMAKLTQPHNITFKNVLLQNSHKEIQGK